jgi:hypothetical protein
MNDGLRKWQALSSFLGFVKQALVFYQRIRWAALKPSVGTRKAQHPAYGNQTHIIAYFNALLFIF